MDPSTACNINYVRIRIAHTKKQDALGYASTRSTLRVFHTFAQRPQREIPHLRKYPYKEGVRTAHCQKPLHVVGCSLPPEAAHELLVLHILFYSNYIQYHTAGFFRGRNLSRISRFCDDSRKFSLKKSIFKQLDTTLVGVVHWATTN